MDELTLAALALIGSTAYGQTGASKPVPVTVDNFIRFVNVQIRNKSDTGIRRGTARRSRDRR